MSRSWFVAICIIGVSVALAIGINQYTKRHLDKTLTEEQKQNKLAELNSSLDGVYEFVSETTTITSPEQSFTKRDEAEWKGLWMFQKGYFSFTMEKRDRSEWTPRHFPDSPRGVGFDGASGKFINNGNELSLDYKLSFYPGRTPTTSTFQYSISDNKITLTEDLRPGRENAATGQRIIILRKITK
jgi:hypothetical protein